MFILGLGTLVPLIPAANGLVLLGLLYPTQQGGTRKLEAPTSQDEIGVTLGENSQRPPDDKEISESRF